MKIGMVGGMGPESTVDYYQQLIKLLRDEKENYPQIIINSINLTKATGLISSENLSGLADMMISAVDSLYKAGSDLAFIASNTPHIVFEEVKQASPIPLVSIVEAVRKEADRRALKKVGLLGTVFTMQSSFYKDELKKSEIEVVVPNDKEQLLIQHRIFSEIEHGIFKKETHDEFLSVIDRLIKDDFIDGVILGCTELPLILTQEEYIVPFLNTAKIHVNEIARIYFENM